MNRKVLLFIILGLIILPVRVFGQAQLADVYPPEEKRDCWGCHNLPNIVTNEGASASQAFCLECHSQASCQRTEGSTVLSLQVKPEEYKATRHNFVACISCHTDVARGPHASVAGVQCLSCHTRHGEGEAHDPHGRVRCEACHRSSLFVTLDRKTDTVMLAAADTAGSPVYLAGHELADVSNEAFCSRKCHQPGNTAGAPAAVLPAKSVLCILCHTTSWSMGHPLFWIGALVFVLGVLGTVFVWFGGSVAGERESLHKKIGLGAEAVWSTIFSRKLGTILKIIVYDVLFQRRILKESVQRWGIHTLIYLGFIIRLFLALGTGLMAAIAPECPVTIALMNKNHPFTAFMYDFLGLMIVVGVLWAVIRRLMVKPSHSIAEGQDKVALGLVGLLILVGFILEGARILVTQIPPDVAVYSFVGYPVSRLLSLWPANWPVIYGPLWYIHAVLGVVFVAYLPFSKMKHILFTPLVLAINYDIKD